MPKVIQVIESHIIRGYHPDERCRKVAQYHSLDGKLLAEDDPAVNDLLKEVSPSRINIAESRDEEIYRAGAFNPNQT